MVTYLKVLRFFVPDFGVWSHTWLSVKLVFYFMYYLNIKFEYQKHTLSARFANIAKQLIRQRLKQGYVAALTLLCHY